MLNAERAAPLILFDLDGVITSEASYQDAAGLMLRTLLSAPDYLGLADWAFAAPTSPELVTALRAQVLPDDFLIALKGRAINSNWDIGYIAALLALLALLRKLAERDAAAVALLAKRPIDGTWLQALGTLLQAWKIAWAPAAYRASAHASLAATEGVTGLALIERLRQFGGECFGLALAPGFARNDSLWALCYDLFQGWYVGGGPAVIQEIMGRAWSGLIAWERPLLPLPRMAAALAELRAMNCRLGIATGRPYAEAIPLLQAWGILEYFDRERIVTHREVLDAEQALAVSGPPRILSKPHPFGYARAACPAAALSALSDEPVRLALGRRVIVVGDSVSDMIAGRQLGAITVAVLSGAGATDASALLATHPDYVLPDMTALPGIMPELSACDKS
jgi:phosphoglycolate phosphatase-like HAD superfamily hydrolase